MRVFAGGCHCGNLTVSFATERPPSAIPVRRCTCSFCTRHGARTATDHAGRVEFTVRDAAALSRYRFGLRTADFLVCRNCGVYVGAVLEMGERALATVNVNVLDERDAFTQPAAAASYEGENADQRIARRVAGWTPAVLHAGALRG